MPRALWMGRTVVPAAERQKFLERLRQRRAYYQSARCRYWAFEDAELPGAFLEFVEADDAATLHAAQDGAPEPLVDARRTYQEVELT